MPFEDIDTTFKFARRMENFSLTFARKLKTAIQQQALKIREKDMYKFWTATLHMPNHYKSLDKYVGCCGSIGEKELRTNSRLTAICVLDIQLRCNTGKDFFALLYA